MQQNYWWYSKLRKDITYQFSFLIQFSLIFFFSAISLIAAVATNNFFWEFILCCVWCHPEFDCLYKLLHWRLNLLGPTVPIKAKFTYIVASHPSDSVYISTAMVDHAFLTAINSNIVGMCFCLYLSRKVFESWISTILGKLWKAGISK